VSTTGQALREVFSSMPPSRVALENNAQYPRRHLVRRLSAARRTFLPIQHRRIWTPTAQAKKQSRNFSQQKLTIGVDLGDRSSCYCVLDEAGRMHRKLAQQLGSDVAVFATARKLATLIYRLLRWGQPCVDQGAAAYENRYRQQRIGRLAATAKQLGFQLTTVPDVNLRGEKLHSSSAAKTILTRG